MKNKYFDYFIFIFFYHPKRKVFLLGLFVLLMFPPIYFSYKYLQSYKIDLTQKAYDQKEDAASLVASVVEERLNLIKNLALSIASRPRVVEAILRNDWVIARRTLSDIRPLFSFIERIVFFDLDGVIREEIPSAKVIGEERSSLAWFKRFQKEKELFITNVYKRGAKPQINVVSTIAPIKNNGKIIGILEMQIALNVFHEWAERYRSRSKGEFVIILDSLGHLVSHPHKDSTQKIYDYSSLPIVQNLILNKKSGIIENYNSIDMEKRLAAYRYIPKYGWGVIVTQPIIEAFVERDVKTRQMVIATVVALFFLLLILVGFYYILLYYTFAQLASNANQAKNEFVSNISHEIRTPLNSVVGFTEHLLENENDDNKKQYLSRIGKSAHTLLALVNNILEISKIESGRITFEEKEFGLSDLIDEIIDIFSEKVLKKGISFETEISQSLSHIAISSDPLLIERVLINLIGNAIKFTQQGTIKLCVRLSDNFLYFSVHDTGIGIPKNKKKYIFQRFSQIDSSSTKRYEGTGLGLSICKEIVNLMKGEISFDSQEGQGSVFLFKIPFKKAKSGQQLIKMVVDREQAMKLKLKILLVDDSTENKDLICLYLVNYPYDIDYARDGVEAVSMFAEKKYDLVLMDMQMPVMDGYEATKKIRHWEKNKKLPNTPIIAITAFALKDEREKCLAAGCSMHLAKPIEKDQLLAAITENVLFLD